MSDFGKAFRREFGKNTGKFVSNVVFGDKHSTPYRRVEAARRERQSNINARHAERMQMQHDRIRERSRKNDLFEERNRILQNESKARIDDIRKNKLYAVDSAVNAAIDNLLSVPIPSEISELEQYILGLQVQVNASKSEGFRDEIEIRKKYLIALRERFFQAFHRLELLSPNSYVIDGCISTYEDMQYEKYCDNTPKVKTSDKFGRLAYILQRYIPVTRQRIEKELEILIYYSQKYEWSKEDLLKGYKIKAFNRSLLDAEKLAEIDPDNPLIGIVKDREKALHKSKRRKLILIIASIALWIFALLCLIYGKVFFWSCVIIGCLIPIIYYSVKYYQRNRHKIKSTSLPHDVKIDELTADRENIDEVTTELEEIDEDQIREDIFVDLNQQNRISDTLKNIWDRYKDSIPDTIFNRSPIFAVDGVKESILFVGVNPSYNESDDEVLISAENQRSLLYGSFYKRSDAPEYFRTLEEFTSELGFAYSQMNLLYLRENDRNVLAQLNSEFIREQLELTYDTIQYLQPTAIIFMSDWCRQLIDGPGRWVDSKKGQPDNLTLNGTNIPVFFSDDISILNKDEKSALARRIKIRLMP